MLAGMVASMAAVPRLVSILDFLRISVFIVQIWQAVSFQCCRSASVAGLLIARVRATRVV